jgi:hypothetical protein
MVSAFCYEAWEIWYNLVVVMGHNPCGHIAGFSFLFL